MGKALAKQLQLEEGAKAICIKRLRCINGVAAILEVDYFNGDMDFMMEADVETRPILDVIRENSGWPDGSTSIPSRSISPTGSRRAA